MVDVLEWATYGEALGAAGSVLRANAASAGLAARVPTCPGWRVADLVTHVGVVHRWAAGCVRGEPDRPDADVAAEASRAADLLDWFDDGLVDLLNALAAAPADLSGDFFLPDAPPLRWAWARRQAHETTIHGVDAMAARLGRAPAASEVWFDRAFALDGIDELLTGFLPRPKYAPTPARPERVLVAPADADRGWSIELSPAGAVTTRVEGERRGADVTLGGSARALYLGLWNRGDEIVASDAGWLDGWRGRVRVTW